MKPREEVASMSSNFHQSLISLVMPIVLCSALLTSCEETIPTDLNNDDNNSLSAEERKEQLIGEALQVIQSRGGIKYFTIPDNTDLKAIPQDPKNLLTPAKVLLGKNLFFETGIAVTPLQEKGLHTYSCSSCHNPGAAMTSGNFQGMAEGGIDFGINGRDRVHDLDYQPNEVDALPFKTPSNLNTAFFKTATWNGKLGAVGPNEGTESAWTAGSTKEFNRLGYLGLETQAIAGMRVHRMIDWGMFESNEVKIQKTEKSKTSAIYKNKYYTQLFDLAFPTFPKETRISQETVGLAIAAFGRTMLTYRAPFQKFLRGNHDALSEKELRGLKIFFGKGQCVTCHSSPGFNSDQYHALAVPDYRPEIDGSIINEPNNEFQKGRGEFTKNPNDDYKFKVPQLYNLKDMRFYTHGNYFNSLRDVIEYKNHGIPLNENVPDENLSALIFKVKLNLSETEVDDLLSFLEDSLYDPNVYEFAPQELPTGFCFPNNDEISQGLDSCLINQMGVMNYLNP